MLRRGRGSKKSTARAKGRGAIPIVSQPPRWVGTGARLRARFSPRRNVERTATGNFHTAVRGSRVVGVRCGAISSREHRERQHRTETNPLRTKRFVAARGGGEVAPKLMRGGCPACGYLATTGDLVYMSIIPAQREKKNSEPLASPLFPSRPLPPLPIPSAAANRSPGRHGQNKARASVPKPRYPQGISRQRVRELGQQARAGGLRLNFRHVSRPADAVGQAIVAPGDQARVHLTTRRRGKAKRQPRSRQSPSERSSCPPLPVPLTCKGRTHLP